MRSALRGTRLPTRRLNAAVPSKHHSTSVAASTPESSGTARLRFAPSPTGFLHLGGLRTALFNHLLARKWGGKWLLRIEDTDQSRLVDGAVDALRHSLEWAGLEYDEGVGIGGSHGPYTQSERLDLYRHYANQLVEDGHAYECFCSQDELQAIKLSLRKQGKMHSYDGRCSHLSRDDVQQRKRAGHQYTVRFKTSTKKEPLPEDLIFGQVRPMEHQDDFIILKSDSWPTYHLASVVDDHLMEITHVLRGEEWLPSLTKHHELYKALGWEAPKFGHLPLLVNVDGTKLSKRTGDVRVDAYREKGYEPEALVNFLGLMGWDYHHPLETTSGGLPVHTRSDNHSFFEVFSLPQLVDAFDVSLITHHRSVVNMEKLDFLNKMTLRRKVGRLGADGNLIAAGKCEDPVAANKNWTEMVKKYQSLLREQAPLAGCELVEDFDYVGRVFDAELPRTVLLRDMPLHSIFYYADPVYDCLESQNLLKTLRPSVYIDAVETVIQELEAATERNSELDADLCWEVLNTAVAKLGMKRKSDLMLPVRHALTARKAGPSIPEIMTVFGRERTLRRLRNGLMYVKRQARD